jgi:hypothetical protein
LRKVGGLFSNTLYNLFEFSLPPIKTDRHNVTEKLSSMAKIDEQINNKFADVEMKLGAIVTAHV